MICWANLEKWKTEIETDLKNAEYEDKDTNASMSWYISINFVVKLSSKYNSSKSNGKAHKLNNWMKIIPKRILMSEVSRNDCSNWKDETPSNYPQYTMVFLCLSNVTACCCCWRLGTFFKEQYEKLLMVLKQTINRQNFDVGSKRNLQRSQKQQQFYHCE